MPTDQDPSQEELLLLTPEPEQEDEAQPIINDSVRKQGAAMAASGATRNAIKVKLKLSTYGIKKLFQDEEFKRLVAEIGDDAVAGAKNEMRSAIARMTKKAVVALEKNLDKHNLEAVKTWLRVVGLEKPSDNDNKGEGFTLVLANQQPQPKTVEVRREGDE